MNKKKIRLVWRPTTQLSARAAARPRLESDRLEQPEQEREHCAELGEHQQLINPQVQPNELVARLDRQRQKRPVFDSAAERVANVLPPVPAGRLTQVVVNVNVRPGDGKERDAEDEEAGNGPRDRDPGNSGFESPAISGNTASDRSRTRAPAACRLSPERSRDRHP